MEAKTLKRNIQSFSLIDDEKGDLGYKRVLLQLFGYTGHGKSSFIISCNYVLADGEEYKVYAKAGQKPDGGSMTMERNAYDLTSNITIVDNRGCKVMHDFERAEVYAQLGNFYPLNKPVEWTEDFSKLMSILEENEMNPNTSDFLVPIFVYNAKTKLEQKEQDDVMKCFNNCVKMTGVFPIIIITNKTSGDYSDAKKKFESMGAEMVIAIENYTVDNHMKTLGRTTDILKILDWALKNVKYRLVEQGDPNKERRKRKNFLNNYMHEASLKHEREQKKKREREEKEKRRREEEKSIPWYQKFCTIQ